MIKGLVLTVITVVLVSIYSGPNVMVHPEPGRAPRYIQAPQIISLD